MDHAGFQDWLNRYIDAWRSTDPAAIGALFSEDATYSYGPYREPLVGREAIVRDWIATAKHPNTKRLPLQRGRDVLVRPVAGSRRRPRGDRPRLDG